MTDTEINIAIAELCGWTDVHIWEDFNSNSGLKEIRGILPSGCQSRVPNYSQDLNAMASAETTLSEKEQVWYLQKLSQVRLAQGNGGMIACMLDRLAFATAHQRAEAFLRVKGKWKE